MAAVFGISQNLAVSTLRAALSGQNCNIFCTQMLPYACRRCIRNKPSNKSLIIPSIFLYLGQYSQWTIFLYYTTQPFKDLVYTNTVCYHVPIVLLCNAPVYPLSVLTLYKLSLIFNPATRVCHYPVGYHEFFCCIETQLWGTKGKNRRTQGNDCIGQAVLVLSTRKSYILADQMDLQMTNVIQ